MSASRIWRRIFGQSSPGPSSDVTPGRMSRSAMRTVPELLTSCSFNANRSSSSSLSVLDDSFDDFSEQLSANALRDIRPRSGWVGARWSIPAPAPGRTGTLGHPQHGADDRQDDADGPQHRHAEQESDEHEDDAEYEHVDLLG